MPCVFLKNVPASFAVDEKSLFYTTLEIFQTHCLYAEIAEAAGCQADNVEIHISNESYQLLSKDSGLRVACLNIHGFVVWFGQEKRDATVKQKIADALQRYLNYFGIGKGFDLTFMDMPSGSFFVEEDGQSIMVEGGEILPSFSLISEAVGEVTGFGRDE